MSEKFVRLVAYAALAITVILGIILTVVGGMIEGWTGVGVMFAGQAVFIALLYLYNRKYK